MSKESAAKEARRLTETGSLESIDHVELPLARKMVADAQACGEAPILERVRFALRSNFSSTTRRYFFPSWHPA